jgi:hypothetical protein
MEGMMARLARISVVASWAALSLVLCPLAAAAASATVTWTPPPPPDPVDGYKVYYDVVAGPPYNGTQANEGPSPIDVPIGSLANPDAPEIELTGLDTCQVFHFAITAYNSSGESGYSTPAAKAVMDAPDPVTVAGLTPEALEVSWAGLPSEDQGSVRYYEVHYDTDSGEPYRGPGSPIVVQPSTLSDPDNPSFVLSSLTTGTTYYMAVRTVCAGSEGSMSEEVEGTPQGGGTGGGAGVGGTGVGNAGGTGAAGNSGGSSPDSTPYSPDVQGDQSSGCSLCAGPAEPPLARFLIIAAFGLWLGVGRRR